MKKFLVVVLSTSFLCAGAFAMQAQIRNEEITESAVPGRKILNQESEHGRKLGFSKQGISKSRRLEDLKLKKGSGVVIPSGGLGIEEKSVCDGTGTNCTYDAAKDVCNCETYN